MTARVVGTARPARTLPADRRLCVRCGIECTNRTNRPTTGMCRDCLTVIRYQETPGQSDRMDPS